MTSDPYVDPDTGVLRNRLEITDPHLLRVAEADLTFAAIQALSTGSGSYARARYSQRRRT